MAFDPSALSIIVQPIGGEGIRFVSYRSDDGLGALITADYFFGAAAYGLQLHDIIFVTPATVGDSYALVVVAIDADGNATAEPSLSDTAVQPDDLATVATTGAYADLTGKPTLGTAAALDSIDEDDMASNSATKLPTQQSVKAYVDAHGLADGSVTDAKIANPSILYNRVYGHIDITDYGAIGDGTTDNATAWSNAIDAAITQKKVVEIPPGDFYISAGKTLTSANNGFGIIGTSKMRSRLLTDANSHILFIDCSASSFNWLEFRNFRATYTGTGGARTAANAVIRYGQTTPNAARGVNRMTHDELYIEGFYHAVRFGAVGRSAWAGSDQIERYYVSVISNCHVVTNGATGVVPAIGIIADRGSGAHGSVFNNVIESSISCVKMGDGTLDAGCGDQLITSNQLLGTDAGCIAVDIYGPSNWATGGYNQNFTIAGNQFDGLMATTVRMRNMKNFRIIPNNSTAAAGIDVATNCSDYIIEDRNTVTGQDWSVDDLTVRSTNGARFTQPLALRRSVDTDRIVVSGGNTGTAGAQISAYGGTHATLPNNVIVDADTTIIRNKAAATALILQPGVVNLPGAYSSTSASAANLLVESDGRLRRSTSALKYKDVEGPIPPEMVGKLMDLKGFLYRAKDDPDGRLYVGMAADHFHEAGLTELVSYNEAGEPEGLQYERLTALLVEKLREVEKRLSDLED